MGQIIVYDLANAIYLNASKINGLRTLITPLDSTTSPIQPTEGLYFNAPGANAHAFTDGNIYIDCSPTGNSRETSDVPFNTTKVDVVNSLTNPFFVLIVATILFVVILLVCYTGVQFVVGDDIEFAFLKQLRSKIIQTGKDIAKKDSYISRNIENIGTGVRKASFIGAKINNRFTTKIPAIQ